ncbi:MAG: Asp-tRNA(Asn)/Glu-tRNA(Gln) amidotransferase subunit GatA [Candidatus Methylacidiphilales bacterium]
MDSHLDFNLETLGTLRTKLRSKELHPLELLEALENRVQTTEPVIQGYLRRDLEKARLAAAQSPIDLPLGGIPIAIKDNINEAGEHCTCGSRFLASYLSPYDATVIQRLKAAGAYTYGRTNMDEFAMGSSTEHSAFQITRNPWDPERIPGGSSGGSAAVVGARSAVAALGSDTGGSIRQPAALCGCVGMKPSYGMVSRYGLVAFASSLDQIGTFTRTVQDSALLLQVIAGYDPKENTSLRLPTPDFSAQIGHPVKGLRLGVPKEYFGEGIDPEVRATVGRAMDWMAAEGAELVEISLPHTEYAIAVYYIIATAEASSNLARFDGVRYGHRSDVATDMPSVYFQSREEGFGPEVKRRIILGTYVLSSGFYGAYYQRAQKVRQLMKQDFDHAFKTCDLILSPTSPTPAFKFGERLDNPLQMYLADVFTIAANAAGICGLSLPCGFTRSGLPVGLQLMGPSLGEPVMFRAAHAYEQGHDWWKKVPAIGGARGENLTSTGSK